MNELALRVGVPNKIEGGVVLLAPNKPDPVLDQK